MRRIVTVLAVLALLVSAPTVDARRHLAAATPAPLTYTAYCIQPDGSYGLLVTGAGTSNQPIDWAANAAFSPLGNHGDNHLEGDSGALGFTVSGYPNGVWLRWSDSPSVVTHAPLPPSCATPTHVIVVWLENKEASAITATSMPYLYGLSTQYGRATAVYGVSHPSEPNYLAFWSGSTQGVTDDGVYDFGERACRAN